jgi:hypothetical protein
VPVWRYASRVCSARAHELLGPEGGGALVCCRALVVGDGEEQSSPASLSIKLERRVSNRRDLRAPLIPPYGHGDRHGKKKRQIFLNLEFGSESVSVRRDARWKPHLLEFVCVGEMTPGQSLAKEPLHATICSSSASRPVQHRRCLMTPSKCATLLGLQVQSVVAKESSPQG